RLENANVVDPEEQTQHNRAFFGATVTYVTTDGSEVENTVTIVGVDEAEHGPGRVTLVSPVARALLRAEVGDEVYIRTPAGNTLIEVIEIRYDLNV
ncbi:MAG: transcription elongation factor GreB, partial [Rhodospirillales bacterium]|nr:transcription elongation factor GreB [Rhodospirillales bacterium]